MGVVTGKGVDDRFGVPGSAPGNLVGEAEAAEILEHEDKVVCRLVERREVRARRPQRVGQADLLIEANLAQVELEALADGRSGFGVHQWQLHDHGSGHARLAVQVRTV